MELRSKPLLDWWVRHIKKLSKESGNTGMRIPSVCMLTKPLEEGDIYKFLKEMSNRNITPERIDQIRKTITLWSTAGNHTIAAMKELWKEGHSNFAFVETFVTKNMPPELYSLGVQVRFMMCYYSFRSFLNLIMFSMQMADAHNSINEQPVPKTAAMLQFIIELFMVSVKRTFTDKCKNRKIRPVLFFCAECKRRRKDPCLSPFTA